MSKSTVVENIGFSFIGHSFESYKENITEGLFPEGIDFSEKEKTDDARKKRLKKIQNDFWAFDELYFPPAFYQDTYSEPNVMHKYIANIADVPGIHVIFGPRKHGKSPTGRKKFIHKILTGKLKFPMVMSEDLLVAKNIMVDIYLLIDRNPRIKADFKPKFSVANADELRFTFTQADGEKGRCFVSDFSFRRSTRGKTILFSRPDGILGDDLETSDSPMSKDAIKSRQDKIAEAFSSCTDNATFLIFGNDFTERGMLHKLKELHEKNLLAEHFSFASFSAWNKKRHKVPGTNVFVPQGCLWPQRYKASSEAALRKLLKPLDDADWNGNFQQNPMPPEGMYFMREDYQEWDKLPGDLRSVLYTDPNLSKKGKGDTTAATGFGYSSKNDAYYVPEVICKSFSDSNDLLHAILKMRERQHYAALGFDGHVSQESSWTMHVKNFSRINNVPYPVIEYKHYRCDDLAKNFQIIFHDKKVFFPPGFSKTEFGTEFLQQFFAFTGVKLDNGLDDGPESIICALEFLCERKIVKRHNTKVRGVKDYYND